MTLLPPATVRAHVEVEMESAAAWAERHSHDLHVDEGGLSVGLRLRGPRSDGSGEEAYLLRGSFEDYRAVPPAWWFVHPTTEADVGPPAYPGAATPAPRGSHLFITGGPTGAVICAYFNRLAYAEEQGPHGDWGAPTNWLSPPPSNYARAETIGDMLARITLEVRESAGRMAPLP